jgi:hypothetical protein
MYIFFRISVFPVPAWPKRILNLLLRISFFIFSCSIPLIDNSKNAFDFKKVFSSIDILESIKAISFCSEKYKRYISRLSISLSMCEKFSFFIHLKVILFLIAYL